MKRYDEPKGTAKIIGVEVWAKLLVLWCSISLS
ncbi:hypothetical protein CCACVL1_20295 [Corchorus capsularis]|uniref:Uncharacterized protein n=1 Tax=Corchorus capsularis TaxID=210143 RepID=A0A1R3HBV5_COCAP|nr:hypothetical protein CCACVL1_20295 [Corchorus capsularis]